MQKINCALGDNHLLREVNGSSMDIVRDVVKEVVGEVVMKERKITLQNVSLRLEQKSRSNRKIIHVEI